MAENKNIWMLVGIAIIAFLVVTTPGWKEVLGISNFNIDLQGLGPVLIVLGFMGALFWIATSGEGKGGGES